MAGRNGRDGALEKMSQARRALAEAKKLGKVSPRKGIVKLREVKDQAEAVRNYAKKIGIGLELQNDVAEIKIDAEREMGRLLASDA